MPDQSSLLDCLRAVCAISTRPLSGRQDGAQPVGKCSCSSSPLGPTCKPEPLSGVGMWVSRVCQLPASPASWRRASPSQCSGWVPSGTCCVLTHPALSGQALGRRGGGWSAGGGWTGKEGPAFMVANRTAEAGVPAHPRTSEGSPLHVHTALGQSSYHEEGRAVLCSRCLWRLNTTVHLGSAS